MKICNQNKCQGGLKSSYDDIIPAVDNSFDQWERSTTLMEEAC